MYRKHYYVYIMTNQNNRVLYTGVTNDLKRRVWQHREKVLGGFTERYKVTKLVYCEEFSDIRDAIAREKQIKAEPRKKKMDLINSLNPQWNDLYESL